MRKRSDAATAPIPAPCGHPSVTFGGETAPACLWGRDLPFPSKARGTSEEEAVSAAQQEHMMWVGLKSTPRPDLLDPFGRPWDRRPFAISDSDGDGDEGG